jgi:flagellar export protein FliJ
MTKRSHTESSGSSAASRDALHSVERWRAAELDKAQGTHAERQKTVDERAAAVQAVQNTIEESNELARAQASGRVLSVDALARIRHYTAAQLQKLDEASQELDSSKREAEAARLAMCRKFEELSAVEKLRDRRSEEAARDAERQNQKRLDDQALLRVIAGRWEKKSIHDDDN